MSNDSLVDSYRKIIEDFRELSADPGHIEAMQRLHSEYKNQEKVLEGLSEAADEDSKKRVRALKTNLRRLRSRLMTLDGAAFTGSAADSLGEFDIGQLGDDGVTRFMDTLSKYHATNNGHFVLEVFLSCVYRGMNPPAWVMNHLFGSFAAYLYSGKQDYTEFLKRLGITAEASGKTSLWDEYNSFNSDRELMLEMSRLVRSFGLSINAAAECLILKHELDASLSTLKRKFSGYFGWMHEGMVESDGSGEALDPVERTKFFDSFPPAAKTIIRKNSSR